MKKIIVATLALALLAAPAFAVISGSLHDLSGNGFATGSGDTETCSVCHTPHNADTPTPLWDHDSSTSTFTLYASSTLDGTITTPTSISVMCLGCHDGVTAIDSFGGVTGGNTMTDFNATTTADFGTNLSDDHPISIIYDVTDTELNAVADTFATGNISDYLFQTNTTVECASCHDVHDNAGTSFMLVMDNANSNLCIGCHAK